MIKIELIGQFIKTARKSKGLTLSALSKESGVSQPFISQIENGTRKPSPEILNKLAGALDIPHSVLMEKAGYTNQPREIEVLEARFYALEQEIEIVSSELSKTENSLKQQLNENEFMDIRNDLQEKLERLQLEQNQIQGSILSLEKNRLAKSFKTLGNSLVEHLAKTKSEENEAIAIYLDENNEGNFYFFNKEGHLPDEVQEKLRSLIKLTLS